MAGNVINSLAVPVKLLPPCEFISAEACCSDLLLPGGFYYCGDVKESSQVVDGDDQSSWQPHGNGVAYSLDSNKTVRSGAWCDGKLHGKGWLMLADGVRLDGNFIDDRCRWGKHTMRDGRIFEGTFKDVEEGTAAGFPRQQRRFGAEWDADGKLVVCGHWSVSPGDAAQEVCTPGCVPLHMLRFKTHIPEAEALVADPANVFLMPNGHYFFGTSATSPAAPAWRNERSLGGSSTCGARRRATAADGRRACCSTTASWWTTRRCTNATRKVSAA